MAEPADVCEWLASIRGAGAVRWQDAPSSSVRQALLQLGMRLARAHGRARTRARAGAA